MDIAYFGKGLLIGFSIAAPVGPIGLLCFQRAMNQGMLHGFLSGLGAATADAMYGLVAAFGLTAVMTLLVGAAFWLKLVGGLFLVWLGWQTLRARPATQAAHATSAGLAGSYAGTFALTALNPATILSFVAIFAGAGVAAGTGSGPALMVAGVFAGSAAWWLILCTLAVSLRTRFGARQMRWLNVLSGLLITGFGVWMLGSVTLGVGR
ncbi:LysE family translocator [Oxalobacteraceae bacterium OM1]|nr:LysE family translocator [Oxalobacteraceae bacterium OM1]